MTSEPRSAAACIIVRGDTDPQVLLAQRNPAARFMGGHYVFPGGRIQADEDISRVAHATSPLLACAIQAAAREAFEETGLLCVRGELPTREILAELRHRLLREEISFHDLLAQHDLTIDAGDFLPAGEWLTPSFVPIRFATHYFLHHLRHDQPVELIEGEIVALDWVTPAEARRRWHLGEMKISTPVAYTLRQMAAVGLPRALPLLQRGTERLPGEHNWFEVRRGITLVPVKSATLPPATHTNCIIVGEQTLYVIDPGAHEESEQQHLSRQIDHLIELGGKFEAILLSHSHPDHVAGALPLRDQYQVPILAHAATAAQLPFPVDRHLQDGEVLHCGHDPAWQLQCLHTPGHDPGHLCFLETLTGSLLAGDMVANPGSILISREYAGDMGDFIRSLERLLTIDCKLIIPAHGQPAGRPHEFIQQQLDHRLWREAKIRDAYEAGARTFEELLARAYDDAPEPALLWARHSLDAHLAKLGIDLRPQ
jgi:glyoxylase-like metal-dependent hydrolase (beta-lactamase superfamily II)/8-oxo-dGTP pyrophosphatase MutT (NUDIX family)